MTAGTLSDGAPFVTEACVPFPARNYLYEGPGADDWRQSAWIRGIVGRLSDDEIHRMVREFLLRQPREAQQVLAHIHQDRIWLEEIKRKHAAEAGDPG